MINSNYNILTEMLSSFRQELSDLNAKIHSNLLSIKEEESCVKALMDANADDFKFFSPRSESSFHKKEIEKSNIQKIFYEEQNQKLYDLKATLERKIEQLEKVLKQEGHNITAFNFQEEDRQRIARDLHDTSLQNLVHLVHKIELCNLYVGQDPDKAKQELSLVSESLKEIIDEIRNTIFDLRPMTFNDLGLKVSFERLLEKLNEDGGYEIVSDIENVSRGNNLIDLYIYRVVQEGLNNIVKHADAKRIIFRCRAVDDICLIDIEDDGKGFYEEPEEVKESKHFGLSLMRERIELINGTIHISSSEGEGTKIHMEIPLAE